MTAKVTDDSQKLASPAAEPVDSSLECCNSGCTVCVLDYQDPSNESLALSDTGCPDLAAMIEALEVAERIIRNLPSSTLSPEPESEGGQ